MGEESLLLTYKSVLTRLYKFDERILTLDPRAITYVLNNQQLYEKPWQSQKLISGLIGNGIGVHSFGLHYAADHPEYDRTLVG